jgi:Lipocalin-like domain
MKNSLLLTLIIITTILQSCDERITPKITTVEIEPPVPPTPSTTTDILTAKSWQYNEVLLRGGGKTVAQFSRPNSIGLTTDFATTKVTYKADGAHETEFKGSVSKGKWALSKDEKQLTITDSNGVGAVFDVVTISKTKLEISLTIKKGTITDADWLAKLKSLGLPETSADYTVVFSFVPI